MKEIRALVVGILVLAGPVFAGEPDDGESITDLKKQIQALAEKVKALEQKDAKEAKQEEKAKLNAPIVKADDKGLSVESADKKYSFRLKGLLQLDSRSYLEDGGNLTNDTFVLRRARPIFEGTVAEHFDFKFVPDFGGGTVVIQDAFVNVNYLKEFQVQWGKYKAPVGLELLQSDAQMPFIERGLPTNLVPNRDLGVMAHGEVWDGILLYQGGIFNGLADGRSSGNIDIDDDKDLVGRLIVQPFKRDKDSYVQNLGFGVAGSVGHRSGQANGLTAGYLTAGQQAFFTYNTPAAGTNTTPLVTASGDAWRLAPQAYYYYGPFGLIAEYTISTTGTRIQGTGTNWRRDEIENSAWQVAAAYALTGEDVTYKGVSPKNDFDLDKDGWGAFELVARYGQLNIDGDAFGSAPGSTGAVIGPAATLGSARDAEAFGVGLNWYLNKNIRVSLDYFQTSFYGGNGSNLVVANGEKAVLTRLQLNF